MILADYSCITTSKALQDGVSQVHISAECGASYRLSRLVSHLNKGLADHDHLAEVVVGASLQLC